MLRLIAATLLLSILSVGELRAAPYICPCVNMGPYPSGSGTYLYFAILYANCADGCTSGVPVAYLGNPGAEAACKGTHDCSGCIPLGGGSPPTVTASETDYFTNLTLGGKDYSKCPMVILGTNKEISRAQPEILKVLLADKKSYGYIQFFHYTVDKVVKDHDGNPVTVRRKVSLGVEIEQPTVTSVPVMNGRVYNSATAKKPIGGGATNDEPLSGFIRVDYGGSMTLVRVQDAGKWPNSKE